MNQKVRYKVETSLPHHEKEARGVLAVRFLWCLFFAKGNDALPVRPARTPKAMAPNSLPIPPTTIQVAALPAALQARTSSGSAISSISKTMLTQSLGPRRLSSSAPLRIGTLRSRSDPPGPMTNNLSRSCSMSCTLWYWRYSQQYAPTWLPNRCRERVELSAGCRNVGHNEASRRCVCCCTSSVAMVEWFGVLLPLTSA